MGLYEHQAKPIEHELILSGLNPNLIRITRGKSFFAAVRALEDRLETIYDIDALPRPTCRRYAENLPNALLAFSRFVRTVDSRDENFRLYARAISIYCRCENALGQGESMPNIRAAINALPAIEAVSAGSSVLFVLWRNSTDISVHFKVNEYFNLTGVNLLAKFLTDSLNREKDPADSGGFVRWMQIMDGTDHVRTLGFGMRAEAMNQFIDTVGLHIGTDRYNDSQRQLYAQAVEINTRLHK